MVRVNSALAKIRLLLATQDLEASKQFIRDVEKSQISYVLHHITEATAIDLAIIEAVADTSGIATVVVLDHALTSDITEEIAFRINSLGADFPIECVIVNPPSEPELRMRLTNLGATLFDDAVASDANRTTFH